MSTEPPTTKRKRRRYSCGPCKTLKIKCNLQTPCQACKKVGREDKCYEDPPKPPSSEEISISTRRKKLAKRKRQLESLSEEQELPKNRSDRFESDSGKMLQNGLTGIAYSESPSMTPIPSYSRGEISNNVNLDQDIIHNVDHPRGMLHLIVGESSSYFSNIHVPGLSVSSTSLSDNQITTSSVSRSVSLSSSMLSHSLCGDSLENIRLNPDVFNYEHYNIMKNPQMNERYLRSDLSLNTPNFYLSQPNMTITSPNQDHKDTNFHLNTGLIEAEDIYNKQVMFTFNNKDLNIFKSFLPAFPVLEELLHRYTLSSSYAFYNILNIEEIFNVSKGFFNAISKASSTDTIKIDKHSLKCVSHFYAIMAIGYLLAPWENEVIVNLDKQTVIQGWINISSMIRRIIVDSTKITDILFSIEWYFIIRDFFTYNCFVLDDYASFISVIEFLKLNTWILETIKKDPKTLSPQTNKDVVRVVTYWIHLRMVDLEVPYIMSKGTFIGSTEFANAMVPDQQTFDFLFEDEKKLTDPYKGIYFQISKLFFNRIQYTASTKLFIRSYLEFFCDISSMSQNKLKDFKKASLEPDFGKADSDLISLVKNQFCQHVALKWLSFMNIEFPHYFPSLRCASYLTSTLNSFNHFNRLDNAIKHRSKNRVSLIDRLLQTCNFKCFSLFVRCLVYQGLFVMTLKNFNTLTHTVLNLHEIFGILKYRFQSTFAVFWNNDQIQSQLYSNLPFFRNSFGLCHQMCRILDSDAKHDLLDSFIAYLESDMALYGFLTQIYFASSSDLKQYLEILWHLLVYLKSTDQTTQLVISELMNLNMDLLNSRLDDPTGLVITSETVDDFAKLVIEPNMHE